MSLCVPGGVQGCPHLRSPAPSPVLPLTLTHSMALGMSLVPMQIPQHCPYLLHLQRHGVCQDLSYRKASLQGVVVTGLSNDKLTPPLKCHQHVRLGMKTSVINSPPNEYCC